MTTNAVDRHARKQLLLTRIALERAALPGELKRVAEAAHWPNLLPNLLRGAVGDTWARGLLGTAGPVGSGGWLSLALTLLRRYRVAAALVGGAAPLLRGRGSWRRLLRVGGLGAAAYIGWRYFRSRHKDTP